MKLKSTLIVMMFIWPLFVKAEILAMLNYESKPKQEPRREGIAIIDVDPNSKNFSKIIEDIPLPPDAIAHHLFYNRDMSKAYLTALGKGSLRVINMKSRPYRVDSIDLPECTVGEDIVFSDDKKTWYLTCMGSNNVIVGDAITDKKIKVISSDTKDNFIRYPHGISMQESIDRMIVTSTVRPSDLGDPGETIAVVEISSGKVLSTHKLSEKASPSGVSPVEVAFLPKSNPPMAYINTMFGGMIWTATWNAAHKNFEFQPAFDFTSIQQGVPLEIYFNQKHDRLYVSTANPGALNVFDIGSTPLKPVLLKSIPTAGGAHHVAFSPDEHYAFVQNSFLNLPQMDDGSISVIDLKNLSKKASIDSLKVQGFKPNSIVLLPQWNLDTLH